MPQVYFWNAEHLSTNAEANAQTRDAEAVQARLDKLKQAGNSDIATPSITRSQTHRSSGGGRGGIAAKRAHVVARDISDLDRRVQRQIEIELSLIRKIERLEYQAKVSRRKVETQQWLDGQPHSVFYCEVQQSFPGNTSSLRNAIAAGGATLCYSTNIVGGIAEPAGFPAAGTGVAGPPGGPHLVLGSARIPKMVVAGGANLFFWHAPSSNNGQVVAAMWNFIKANYAGNNILFGDLNTEPGQLMAQGVPLIEIAAPVGPTRISGRTLDYALSDFQPVLVYRAFDQAAPDTEIKRRFGSDHAAMCMRW